MDDDRHTSVWVSFEKLGLSAFSSKVVSNAERDANVRQIEFLKRGEHGQSLDFG
jgi:hypothetical protein